MITAKQVKTHRKALGLTQAQYASHMHVSTQLVRLHWEKDGLSSKAVMRSQAVAYLAATVEHTKETRR